MRKKLFVILLMAVSMRLVAGNVVYERSDSIRVVSLLEKAKKIEGKSGQILFFARSLCGIPYVAHTLEVGNTERLVVNLRQLDCTTYVENVMALTMCMTQKTYTFRAFCSNLRRIRYRGGAEPAYIKRLHYFSDWIEDNTSMGFCREVQSPNPPFSAVQKINVYYMSANPDKYKRLKANPSYVQYIAAAEKKISTKSYRYIPKSNVRNTSLLRNTVKDGDIIATTTSLKGLDIQHLGIAVWHEDGLHWLNASSLRKKVVEEKMTLSAYLARQKSMTGIRIVRLR